MGTPNKKDACRKADILFSLAFLCQLGYLRTTLSCTHDAGYSQYQYSEKNHGAGFLQEYHETATRKSHGLVERRFQQRAEDKADNHRAGREVESTHPIAEKAEENETDKVEHALVDGIGTEERKDGDGRENDVLGQLTDTCPHTEAELRYEEEQYVAYEQRTEDAIYHSCTFKEDVRARSEPLYKEGPHKNGGYVVAGNAEGQQGYHGGAGHGIVGGFGREDAFYRTIAEPFWGLRGAPRFGIGHEGCRM